jgi:hypothetical protein
MALEVVRRHNISPSVYSYGARRRGPVDEPTRRWGCAQTRDKYPRFLGINIPNLTAFDPECAICLARSLDRVAAAIQTSTKPLNETACDVATQEDSGSDPVG